MSELWQYRHNALSDAEGLAYFTKQDKDFNAGYEGGSLTRREGGQEKRPTALEEVNMTTVDSFLRGHGAWQGKVDILKVDTEGNDNKVLLGAQNAIQHSLGMFTFEGGQGITFSKEMVDSFDSLGYNCYSTSRAGLFKWNGGGPPMPLQDLDLPPDAVLIQEVV